MLRRLAATGEISKDDLSVRRRVVDKASDLIDDNVAAVTPLTAVHLSDPAADAPRIILGAIGPARHVDRLESDTPPIKFDKNCLDSSLKCDGWFNGHKFFGHGFGGSSPS
jgi:hypothetical protein